MLTLRADPKALTLVRPSSPNREYEPQGSCHRVAQMLDVSGRGNHAIAAGAERRPAFLPDALGPGVGARHACAEGRAQQQHRLAGGAAPPSLRNPL